MRKIFITLFIFFASFQAFADDEKEDIKIIFVQWLENFKKDLKEKHGITDDTIEKAFADVRYKHKIIKLDRNQPEFKRDFFDYYEDAIHPLRIKRGKKKIKEHSEILNQIHKKYKIPPQIIVALWGMETDYGRNMGKSPIFQSLATLSFDNRRSKFFTNELIQALKIVQSGKTNVEDMVGSWAGAFGNFQFMPSTYVAYAVDGDGDGKIDLRNSIADAFYSTANYLNKMGWNGKYKWGRVVSFNNKNQKIWSLVNSKEWRKLSYYSKLGVKTYNNKKLPKSNIKARLIAPNGVNGPVFLIYQNFEYITRWNNSSNYAISVGMLSDALLMDKPVKLKRN